MLKPTLLLPILLIFFLSLANNTSAQQLDDLSYPVESTWGFTCDSTSPRTIQIYGKVSASAIPDTIHVIVEWGDGADTQLVLPASNYNPYWGFYTAQAHHSYDSTGNYLVFIHATNATNPGMDNTEIERTVHGSENCMLVSGNVFHDDNENCNFDPSTDSVMGETVVSLILENTPEFCTSTDSNGDYSFEISPDLINIHDSATVLLNPISGFEPTQSCGLGMHRQFELSENATVTHSFPMRNGAYFDLRPGHGTTIIRQAGDSSGYATIRVLSKTFLNYQSTIQLDVDPNLTYLDMILGPAPDSISGNSLFWNLSIPSSNGGWDLALRSRMRIVANPGVLNDTRVYFTATNHLPDSLSSNDQLGWNLRVDGPYDPNNKLVTPQGEGEEGWIENNQTLTYTINFQNTGDAPAINVVIRDTFSEYLDMSTFQIITSSHPVDFEMKDGANGAFMFDRIFLPDSTTDYEGSMGFVTYQVDMKRNLAPRTSIENTAHIYFDWNPAIVTNTAVNTIDTFLHPLINADLRHVTCLQNNNGMIDISMDGGAPPFTYQWSDQGSSQPLRTNLGPGSYSVTVTDSLGQESAEVFVLEENRQLPPPQVGEISGAPSVQSWESYIYQVNPLNNAQFNWQVIGGALKEAAGNSAEVLWHAGPAGSLALQVSDEHGCTRNLKRDVEIIFLGEDKLDESPIQVFPNPTDDFIVVDGLTAGDLELTIQDVNGKLVMKKSTIQTQERIQLKQLPAGIYNLTLEQGGKMVHSTQLVKK